jgi:hypothetical protein
MTMNKIGCYLLAALGVCCLASARSNRPVTPSGGVPPPCYHASGGIDDYPEGPVVGLPNKGYILHQVEVAKQLVHELDPTIQELSSISRPIGKSGLLRGKALASWAKKTADVHERIFACLKKHKKVSTFAILLPRSRVQPETESDSSYIAFRYQMVPGPRTLCIYQSWAQMPNSVQNQLSTVLSWSAIAGTKGGCLEVYTRRKLSGSFYDPMDIAGETCVTFYFNPFVLAPSEAGIINCEAEVTFSQDYARVETIPSRC